VNGNVPSIVLQSARPPVPDVHNTYIDTVLIPRPLRSAKNVATSASNKFTINACGESPVIK
jgi:hypothetical protein